MLIEKLHQQSADYISEVGSGGDKLGVIRDKIDTTLHNAFYVLKIIRSKYEVDWEMNRPKKI